MYFYFHCLLITNDIYTNVRMQIKIEFLFTMS